MTDFSQHSSDVRHRGVVGQLEGDGVEDLLSEFVFFHLLQLGDDGFLLDFLLVVFEESSIGEGNAEDEADCED